MYNINLHSQILKKPLNLFKLFNFHFFNDFPIANADIRIETSSGIIEDTERAFVDDILKPPIDELSGSSKTY